jgi:leucyl aminopeptidase
LGISLGKPNFVIPTITRTGISMALQATYRVAEPATLSVPLLIVPVTSGDTLPAALADLDVTAGGAIARAWAAGDFTGKKDDTLLLYPGGSVGRILLVGLGDAAKISARGMRRAGMIGGKRARMLGVAEAACWIPDLAADAGSTEMMAQALAEGLPFGAWHFPDYKRPATPPKPPLTKIEIISASASESVQRGVARGGAIAAGQALTRGLQVLPADVCTPTFLAARAAEVAAQHGMKCTVLDREAIIAEGMHALLAVAQGSVNEPRFIVMEYEGAAGAPVVLVGKGVTFDTGGISIKPAQSMEEMKYDMSGAAAVIGTFEVLGRLRPAIRVVGLIPTAENMVSGSAYRPGDVVRSHLGKTIEVLNTDAEGRLLLADALSYARRYQPAAVVDCATLTGAVVIGLGHTATAVMGTDEQLIASLIAAGERSDERLWQLPLWDEYRDLIKSDIADMKNTGGRPAGSITAGWFLREFAEDYPWAHLDIAGTAYTDRDTAAQVKGPTGVLVRLFSEFLLARS